MTGKRKEKEKKDKKSERKKGSQSMRKSKTYSTIINKGGVEVLSGM